LQATAPDTTCGSHGKAGRKEPTGSLMKSGDVSGSNGLGTMIKEPRGRGGVYRGRKKLTQKGGKESHARKR